MDIAPSDMRIDDRVDYALSFHLLHAITHGDQERMIHDETNRLLQGLVESLFNHPRGQGISVTDWEGLLTAICEVVLVQNPEASPHVTDAEVSRRFLAVVAPCCPHYKGISWARLAQYARRRATNWIQGVRQHYLRFAHTLWDNV